MKDPELPKQVRDVLYAQRHGLLDDDLGQAARLAFDAGVADEFTSGVISGRAAKHRVARAFGGPYDIPRLASGELVLGADQSGHAARAPVESQLGNSLTIGGSGCGKTNKSGVMALQIAHHVQGMWLFDCRKSEYAALQACLAPTGIHLAVLPGLMARLNPLQTPSGVDPRAWAARVSDMLVDSLELPPRAAKLLHVRVLDLYERHGVLTGNCNYPTLFDLWEAVRTDRDANHSARQATLDSLAAVLTSLGPGVLGYRVGWSTVDLARRHIVFDFSGLADAAQDLLLHTLLLSEFTSRIARGISNARLNLLVAVDEAARLVSPSSAGGALIEALGLVRGTGIAVDLSVQSAAVHPSVFSNTANRFIGRCTNALDLEAAAGSMALSPEQKRYAQTMLVPGTFIAQLGGGWRHPFILRVPELHLRHRQTAQHPPDANPLPMLPAAVRGANCSGPSGGGR
jgi:hypothetical protein